MNHTNEEQSPAIQLIEIVAWQCPYSSKPYRIAQRSRRQWDAALHSALRLAISAQLFFAPDDMSHIYKTYPFRWQAGNGDNWGEDFYSLAVQCGNRSAAISFERMKGRKPFIWPGRVRHGSVVRENDRLSVGDRFEYRGEYVEVTSFNDDTGFLVACSYASFTRRVPVHRHRITHDEVRKARRESY